MQFYRSVIFLIFLVQFHKGKNHGTDLPETYSEALERDGSQLIHLDARNQSLSPKTEEWVPC
jgi:hypothetical protein